MRASLIIFFICVLQSIHAIADEKPINIVGECWYATDDQSKIIKECKDADGTIYKFSEEEKIAETPKITDAEQKERNIALSKLYKCFFKSISGDDTEIVTMRNCVHQGIEWCNKSGEKTSDNVNILTYSGRAQIDNPICAGMLENAYRGAFSSFSQESEIFLQTEASGYRPIIFDIRPYLEKKE